MWQSGLRRIQFKRTRNERAITVMVLLFPLLLVPTVSAKGTRKRQPAQSRTFSSAARHPPASRPYYGGDHHTTSHGGHYYGATNADHLDGHYGNRNTRSRYSVHKRR